MWLSKLNDMSVGPLWSLRATRSAAGETNESACPVCARAWLEQAAQHHEVLIILDDPIADPAQQALLDNCIRAAGWCDVASVLTLHAACSSDAGRSALERQLTATPVRRVIVFGQSAAHRIDAAFNRGAVHPFGPAGLIVTHHPAQLLATPALKAQTWADLCLARCED